MTRSDLRTAGVVAAVFAVVGVAVLGGSRHQGLLLAVVSLGALIGAGILIYEDSCERGRGGGRWVAACLFLAPLGLTLFAVMAVVDRCRGRRGIEAGWDPSRRWYLLGAVVLVIVAGALALDPVRVAGAPGSTTRQDIVGAVSGDCDTPLAVSLNRGPFQTDLLASEPAELRAVTLPVAQRCATAAAMRMTESEVCLVGSLVLALVGAQQAGRREREPEQELTALTA